MSHPEPKLRDVPELTTRSIAVGLVVALIIGSAYPYCVLKLGFGPNLSVVSAFLGFIALVLIMRAAGTNARENNVVQTMGTSAGQTAFMCVLLAAFDLLNQKGVLNPPIHLGTWQIFFWLCSASLLGILLAVPMRRHYIDEENLTYADGMAAGETIKVPNVTPFDINTKPAADAAGAGVEIQVTKEDSSLRVAKSDGTVVFFAPVTTGSEHDPLPTGDYKVTAVAWKPPFHYNPDLFWDAKSTDEKATIKPGPNNPVGVLWIDLSLEHYGIHGTPEPGNVGHTESHGCVRLTNWDAARVAALVKPGTRVLFR